MRIRAAPLTVTAACWLATTVTDTDGAGLEGIQVIVYGAGGERLFAGFTRTDESGEYTVEGLPSGKYLVEFWDGPNGEYETEFYKDQTTLAGAEQAGDTVEVKASGTESVNVELSKPGGDAHQSVVQKHAVRRATLTHVRRAGVKPDADPTGMGSISGQVDGRADAPLEGVTVVAYEAGGEELVAGYTKSGEGGKFEVKELVAGSKYKLQFSAPGYVSQFSGGKTRLEKATPIEATEPANDIGEITMDTSGIEGTVKAEGGSGVEGATVSVYEAGGNEALLKTVKTEAGGAYVITGLEAGEYKVGFSGSGYETEFHNGASKLTGADTVKVETAKVVDIGTDTLKPTKPATGAIEGSVYGEGAGLLPDAWVVVYPEGSKEAAGAAQTGAGGHYEVTGLAAGDYEVKFSADDYVGQAKSASVAAGQTTEDVNAQLAPTTGGIAGQVTDVGGNELEGIDVIVYNQAGELAETAETGAEGKYVVPGLQPGKYKVEFSDGPVAVGVAYLPRFWNDKAKLTEAESVTVTAGQTYGGVNAELRQGGSIGGTVSADTAAGEGLSGVTVTVYEGSTEAATTASGSKGAYNISGLPPGEYKIGFKLAAASGGTSFQEGFYEGASLGDAKLVKVNAEKAAGPIDAALLPQAPKATAPPTITGEAKQGQTLTEHHGTWQNSPESYAYQWERCNSGGSGCSPISGATDQTYTLTAADVGHTVRVKETATNKGGSGTKESAPTAAVAALPSSGSGGGSGGGSSGGSGGGTGTGTTPGAPGQSGPPPAAQGIATATGSAKVKGKVAQVKLHCTGGGACAGVLKLTVKVRSKHHGHGHHAKTRTLVIGHAHFSIAADGHATVRVTLTGQGRKLLKKAGHRGLKVKLIGSDIKARTVKLKSSSGHHGGKHHGGRKHSHR